MIVGLSGVALMSDSNHTTSCNCVAILCVTYSASVVDKAYSDHFLLSQLTAPPNITKTFPIIILILVVIVNQRTLQIYNRLWAQISRIARRV